MHLNNFETNHDSTPGGDSRGGELIIPETLPCDAEKGPKNIRDGQGPIPVQYIRSEDKQGLRADVKDSLTVKIYRVMLNLFLITAGCFCYALGINSILVPQNFLSGGPLGLSIIINHVCPFMGVGLLYALFNIPFYILGYFSVSRKFILYTAYGITLFSVLCETVKLPPFPLHDPILTAILAGVICGIGGGLVLRSSGSAGGTDILAIFLNKKYEIRPGLTYITFNIMVLTTGSFFFGLEKALYSMIFAFTAAKVTDAVLTGFNQRKTTMIVSDKSSEIAEAIMARLHRGVTLLDGCGAYSGNSKQVAFSVISLTELARLKELVFGIDPQAFFVVNDTLEVWGSSWGRKNKY